MFTFCAVGSYCCFPRVAYDPATLPEDAHAAVLEFFRRSASSDMLRGAKAKERPGLLERADEAASNAYYHWRTAAWGKVAGGDHSHAVYATRRYMRLTGWLGMTGHRRKAYRAKTVEMMRERERAAQRTPNTPAAMAVAVERLTTTPTLYRKAMILAKRTGYGTVDAMLAAVAGEGHTTRGHYTPAPLPMAGVAATPGDGTEWRAAGERCEWRNARG